MHVHTSHSDSSGSVDEVLEEARRKGLDGVAITDHKTIRGAQEALKKRGDLIIIPGQEVRTEQCEILALGIKRKIEDDLPVLEAIKRIHAQHGLAVLPHPTVPFFSNLNENVMKSMPLDGIEVFSSITPFPWYFLRKNMKLARKLGIPMLAGSDSHAAETVGDAYTIIRCGERRIEDIIRAIKLGETSIGGGSSKLTFKIKMIRHIVSHIFLQRSMY